MAISILNYYEQPDGKNLMIMADDLYERNPGEAPDDNMPMDPTNYAISQNLGVPADGSITIVRDFDEDKKVKTVTNVFNEGEWKNSTESGGGGEQSGAIKIIERSIKEVSDEDLKGITKIGNYAFYYYTDLTSITIPDSVTSIGSSAFSGCTGLTSIKIPDSVTSIGNGAFKGCSSLTRITIPDSVTEVGDEVFYGCKALNSITIPDSVTSIGDSVFALCSSLTSIKIGNSVTSIGERAFNGCSSLTGITIPNGVTSIDDYTFSNCSSLTSITIPNSVTSIGERAFNGCSSLTSITMPNSVTSIGDYAFSNCSSLKGVYITDLVKWCGISFGSRYTNPLYYAHQLYLNGTLITDLVIPEGVTSIGSWAFYYCNSLTSVTIPDSVTSIGSSAFNDCTGLTNITISDSVTSIGDYAFYNCKNLTDVYYNGDQSSWNSISISSGNTALTNATIHFIGKTESYNNVKTRTESNSTGTTLYITTNS